MPNGQPPTLNKTTAEAGVQITRSNLHWGATLGQPANVTYAFRASIPADYTSTTAHNLPSVDARPATGRQHRPAAMG
jgi:hypothetical protein